MNDLLAASGFCSQPRTCVLIIEPVFWAAGQGWPPC